MWLIENEKLGKLGIWNRVQWGGKRVK